ncbi:replication restart helicase PriA [Thermotoga caldifontis]|uniref:replication restart helicase PriA n=1 Tax=Thermotoga caldifontis TaxID=1508419 RepID=UPI00059726E8|nr:primosomal protein N' [Thermotoga caldifontis]
MVYDLAISKVPLRCLYSYTSHEPLEVGERVLVDFHGRKTIGYVVRTSDRPTDHSLKEIAQRLDRASFLDQADVEAIRTISEKFFSPPGLLFDIAFPSFIDEYAETIVESLTPMLGFESLPLEEFLERYGHKTLKGYLNRGYVRLKKCFGRKMPKPRFSKWYVVVKGGLRALSHAGDETEYDVIGYLLTNNYATVEQLVESFGINPKKLKHMQQKGLIELTQFLPPNVEGSRECRKPEEALPRTDLILTGHTMEARVRRMIELIASVIDEGKAVLFLVPFSSLAYVTAGFIRRFLDVNVNVYHARMSKSQRAKVWLDAVSGAVQLVVGTRIAAFLPVKNLGLIVVEESDEDAYYQFEDPVYDAIELIETRAKLRNIPLVLASCEPRLTDFHRRERFNWFRIPTQPRESSVDIVDVRHSKSILSEELIKNVEETMREGRSIVMLVRRKGFAPYVVCFACNYVLMCPNCDVTLSFHRSENVFKCHQCGYTQKAQVECPNCGARALYPKGVGTERIEKLMKYHFPNARIVRVESEEFEPFEVQEQFAKLQAGEIDVLIGSKLVVHGFDTSRVGLISILDYDGLLNQPDYNTRLRMFHLFRKIRNYFNSARILIQTFHPQDTFLKDVFEQEVEKFYVEELKKRQEVNYPPFCDLIQVVLESDLPQTGWEIAKYCVDSLEGETVLGPVEHPIFKRSGKFRHHFLIKTNDVMRSLSKINEVLIKTGKVGWRIFVNPPKIW